MPKASANQGFPTLLKRLFFIIATIYGVMFAMQWPLIFPSYLADDILGELKTPAAYQLQRYEVIPLTTADKVKVMGWFHPPTKGKPVILYFHGNGMHIGGRADRYTYFANDGYGIFALSYRGYGKSRGYPTEAGLYMDARAAIHWLHDKGFTNVILYGESLGTGVAVQMATEFTVQGVVLQSGYTSLNHMADIKFPYLPSAKYLVLNRFDSINKIAKVNAPVLFIHGGKDAIVPAEESMKLYQAAREPKHIITIPEAGHMDVPDTIIIQSMRDFIGKYMH